MLLKLKFSLLICAKSKKSKKTKVKNKNYAKRNPKLLSLR